MKYYAKDFDSQQKIKGSKDINYFISNARLLYIALKEKNLPAFLPNENPFSTETVEIRPTAVCIRESGVITGLNQLIAEYQALQLDFPVSKDGRIYVTTNKDFLNYAVDYNKYIQLSTYSLHGTKIYNYNLYSSVAPQTTAPLLGRKVVFKANTTEVTPEQYLARYLAAGKTGATFATNSIVAGTVRLKTINLLSKAKDTKELASLAYRMGRNADTHSNKLLNNVFESLKKKDIPNAQQYFQSIGM